MYLGLHTVQTTVQTVRTPCIPQVVLANQGVLNMIREDYPKAMDNAVYDCLDDIEVRHWIGVVGIGHWLVTRAPENILRT